MHTSQLLGAYEACKARHPFIQTYGSGRVSRERSLPNFPPHHLLEFTQLLAQTRGSACKPNKIYWAIVRATEEITQVRDLALYPATPSSDFTAIFSADEELSREYGDVGIGAVVCRGEGTKVLGVWLRLVPSLGEGVLLLVGARHCSDNVWGLSLIHVRVDLTAVSSFDGVAHMEYNVGILV